ncbi:MAG: PEPxxWA-CTERM sorting domain-containing protein [Sphingobium sp.]|jgi:hypothetical protein|nr:PEPxxWA-CTERM sorting domain-containing protein [Sphingobium sp.]MCI1755561.1 PEPxxWA-CTERM sorting domain-containing protein [Sphingobium sp.]
MRLISFASAALLMLMSITPAHSASMIKLNFDVTINSQFDYLTGSHEPINVPINAHVTVSFPTAVTSTDYGNTTITNFGQLGQTSIGYPLLSYIGPDPYGNGLASLGQSAYTFPNVSDYPSTFIEQFAFQDNIYHPSGNQFWAFHSEIRITQRSPSMGGTGTADYAFDAHSLIDFLNDFQQHPSNYETYFNQSWENFARNPDSVGGTYLGGKSWTGTAILTSPASVPEPSTWAILLVGFGAIGGAMRSSSRIRRLNSLA